VNKIFGEVVDFDDFPKKSDGESIIEEHR